MTRGGRSEVRGAGVHVLISEQRRLRLSFGVPEYWPGLLLSSLLRRPSFFQDWGFEHLISPVSALTLITCTLLDKQPNAEPSQTTGFPFVAEWLSAASDASRGND
jgi:hypothetical protein